MGLSDVTGIDEMPVWMRLALYLIDNVFVAILVGVAVYLVQRRIDKWRERSARRVASDQFVAQKIQPLMDAIHENMPLLDKLAHKSGALTYEDECQFGECHERQADEVDRLRTAREFNEAAFEPYRAELDAVEKAMADLSDMIDRSRETGVSPDPASYRELQSALHAATRALSNKSSVAVYAH